MTLSLYSGGPLWTGGSTSIIYAKRGAKFDGTQRIVLAIPGHGSSPAIWDQGSLHGQHLEALAHAGFLVLVVDQLNLWGNDARMTELAAAIAYARSIGGSAAPISIYGMSLGGCDALNFIKRNAADVASAWLFCPATDLDYLYTVGYAAEMDAAYGGNFNANKAGHVPLADAATFPAKPIHIVQGGSDTLVLPETTTTYAANIGASLDVPPAAVHTDVPNYVSPSSVVDFLLANS